MNVGDRIEILALWIGDAPSDFMERVWKKHEETGEETRWMHKDEFMYAYLAFEYNGAIYEDSICLDGNINCSKDLTEIHSFYVFAYKYIIRLFGKVISQCLGDNLFPFYEEEKIPFSMIPRFNIEDTTYRPEMKKYIDKLLSAPKMMICGPKLLPVEDRVKMGRVLRAQEEIAYGNASSSSS